MTEFHIQFPSRFKGKLKETLRLKFKTFIIDFFLSFVLFFGGVFMAFYNLGNVGHKTIDLYGVGLMIAGVLLLIASPFILLFKSYNRGLKGDIDVFLNKKDEVWYYTITTNVKKNPFTSEGKLLLIEVEKYWVMIRGNNARDFYIPCSILTKEELNALKEIAQDYIIKNPQNEEKTNESI